MLSSWWKDARQCAHDGKMNAISIFADMVYSYKCLKVPHDLYVARKVWRLPKSARVYLGEICTEKYKKDRAWRKLYDSNYAFLAKWSRESYSNSLKRIMRRSEAYARHFHLQNVPYVQHGVQIICEHTKVGKLEIGKNVWFLKECFIDYTGDVIIRDNVQICFGAIIQTHYHPYHSDYKLSFDAVATEIVIEEGVVIGSRAIVMPTCHRIGKFARVGAGAVVTRDVPDYAVVVGVPAKVVRCQEVVEV